MYQIVTAYGLAKAANAEWKEHDIKQLTGLQLYSLFTRLYITLSTPSLVDTLSIDFKDYEPILSFDTRKAEVIFGTWSDPAALKTVTVPKYTAGHAVFTDATRADYRVHRGVPGSDITSNADRSTHTEMRLSRPGLDMRVFKDYCLPTANGFFYKGEADEGTMYVPEAGKTLLLSQYNHVGILSFESIGKIQTIALDAASVLPQALDGALYGGINLKLPQVDLTNKSLALVIGGYLHLQEDGIFSPVSEERVVIYPSSMYLMDRYVDSYNRIDWKPILGDDMVHPSYLNIDLLKSDAALMGLVKHAQTFWVVVDTPHLKKAILPIRSLPIPGCFSCAQEPTQMLAAGSGYILEYWKRYQDGEWAVNCSGVRPGFGVRGTIGRPDYPINMSMANLPYSPWKNIQACLVDIIADEIPG